MTINNLKADISGTTQGIIVKKMHSPVAARES